MNNELDELLRQVLTPKDEPDSSLNKSILNQVKEQKKMKKRIWRRSPVMALIALIVLGCASATVFAVYYLSVQDIAERMEDPKLSDAFMGEDAVMINETQSYGGYNVTLLGIVSGKNISKYIGDSNGILLEDRTYAVVAIVRTDGTPFQEVMSDSDVDKESFSVSMLIRDFNPIVYNIGFFNGSAQGFVEDGVLYWIAQCDNMEIFADHGLYLSVCDKQLNDSEAYQFDEETGIISRNENYDGLNALFEVPIDVSKADSDAAKKLLKEIENEEREVKPDLEEENLINKNKWVRQITPENIDMYAERIEDSVQTLTPDEEGFINYKYRSISTSKVNVSDMFEQENFIINGIGVSGSSKDGKAESAYINTLQANDDGTVTYACYRIKQSILEKYQD